MNSLFRRLLGNVEAPPNLSVRASDPSDSWNGIMADRIGDEIRLAMVLDGDPRAWVMYNVQQLDDLIGLLQKQRLLLNEPVNSLAKGQ